MKNLEGSVASLLFCTMKEFMNCLGLNCDFVLSSELNEKSSNGQIKILKLVKAVGGKRYINPSGGRDLYDERLFKKNGLNLEFLVPWKGRGVSILEECREPVDFRTARSRIISQTVSIR